MADLRIFSYLPNPRLFKATIAAQLTAVELEIVGARPKELSDWLWDFNARPLNDDDRADASLARGARAGFSGTLYKTDAFLSANPFGNVPVAFSPDGEVGIFESNSMLRAVARLSRNGVSLYGDDPYSAARIDGFLDATQNFGIAAQRYLFALMGKDFNDQAHGEMEKALHTYLAGIDGALHDARDYLVGPTISIADIGFAAELVLFSLSRSEPERIQAADCEVLFNDDLANLFPAAFAHFHRLLALPAFQVDLSPYFKDMTLAKFLS